MFTLSAENLDLIYSHGEAEYPYECCGLVLGVPSGSAHLDQVRPVANIQNRLHAEDPQKYPRDARVGYTFDPEHLYRYLKEAASSPIEIQAIYHSHIEVGVYFSQEDQDRAKVWDEPAYPGVSYLVVSVCGGKRQGAGAFRWDEESRLYVEEKLRTVKRRVLHLLRRKDDRVALETIHAQKGRKNLQVAVLLTGEAVKSSLPKSWKVYANREDLRRYGVDGPWTPVGAREMIDLTFSYDEVIPW